MHSCIFTGRIIAQELYQLTGEIGETLAVEAWDERCHSTVVGVLAKRGWQLVQDEKAFAGAICLEVQLRSLEGAEQQRVAIERATIRHYCVILYAACSDSGSPRQRRAFKELQEYLYPLARYRMHGADLAEDVTQQALVKTWENLAACENPGSFLNYAALILIHEISDHFRKAYKRDKESGEYFKVEATQTEMQYHDSEDDAGEPGASTRDPSDRNLEHLFADKTRQLWFPIIEQCVENRQYRAVIIELFFANKAYKQISDDLGISVGNVYVYRNRALKILRKCEAFKRFFEERFS